MTYEEAANFIDEVLDGVKSFNDKSGKGREALNLAIEALKGNNLTHTCSTCKHRYKKLTKKPCLICKPIIYVRSDKWEGKDE